MAGRGIFGASIGAALLAIAFAVPAQANMIWNPGDPVCNDPNTCSYNIDTWKGSGSSPAGAPWEPWASPKAVVSSISKS